MRARELIHYSVAHGSSSSCRLRDAPGANLGGGIQVQIFIRWCSYVPTGGDARVLVTAIIVIAVIVVIGMQSADGCIHNTAMCRALDTTATTV